MRNPLVLSILFALGCGASDTEDDPAFAAPAALRCESFGVAAETVQLAENVGGAAQMGPCGHLIFGDPTGAIRIAAPGSDPEPLAESARVIGFSPAGDRLAYRDGARLVVRDLVDGAEVVLGEDEAGTIGWARTAADDFVPHACAEGELRIASPDVATVMADVFECVAAADGAPVVVVRGVDGALRRVDLASGEVVRLPDVDYRAEPFSDEDLARDDHVVLSVDGRVLVHQEVWRRFPGGFVPEDWATAWDARTGAELGVFRTAASYERLLPLAMPGAGHVMVFPGTSFLVVVDDRLRLVGYEGWEVVRAPLGRRVLAREVETGDLHRIDPAAGVTHGVVARALTNVDRVRVSPGGEVAAGPFLADCEWRVAEGYCRTIESVWRWRDGHTRQLPITAEGTLGITWIGDGGELLLEGQVRSGGAAVDGTYLVGAGGEVVRGWPSLRVRSVSAAGATLLVVLYLPGTGASELHAVDLATGRDRTLASAERGIEVHVDGTGRTMAWIPNIPVEDEMGFRLERPLYVAPVPRF